MDQLDEKETFAIFYDIALKYTFKMQAPETRLKMSGHILRNGKDIRTR